MSKIIEVIYENGVFKPLEKVDLKEGERVKIKIEREREETIKSYKGIFGKADAGELREFEEAML